MVQWLAQFIHRRKIFVCLSRRIRTDGVVESHHNDPRTIHHRVKNDRSPDILASALVNPHHSVRRMKVNSGVSRGIIYNILKDNTFYPYRIGVHQEHIYNDIEQRIAFCDLANDQPPDFIELSDLIIVP